MQFQSVNPFNGQVVSSRDALSAAALAQRLSRLSEANELWRKTSVQQRSEVLKAAATVLRTSTEEYARMISIEMGKPIKEARAEVVKCAWVCEYYAENAAHFLEPEVIATDANRSYVRHDPIGTVFGIMPWNFPFWQVFRFLAPTLMAGNTALLKHAPNVFGCAELIEQIMLDAGLPEDVFQNLIIHHDSSEQIIAHDQVQAVTLTGSGPAGSAVASLAGKHLKRSLLELGGSNAFVVLDDADIEDAVKTAVTARMMNAGQSCIAAKRFLIHENVARDFVAQFGEQVKRLKPGDPLEETTTIGPLARLDLADALQRQVAESVAMGAQIHSGGKQTDCFHEPTILTHVTAQMPAFREETFGPLASITTFSSDEEAFALAEDSSFGLGITICTSNIERSEFFTERVRDGAVFVNELVKSDPRLPFGGTKQSGYGRELSKDGLAAFVNRKTVYIK